MSNSVFKKWTSAVLYLDKKIKDNRLIAGRNIQLENTGDGIRVNSQAKRSENNAYKGYFKVIQTAANKIEIVDGMDITAVNCGTRQINKFTKTITATELIITANAFIYLESILVGNPATSVSATIKQSTTYPAYEAGKEKTLISRAIWDSNTSKIKDFTREVVPDHIIVWGTC